AHAAVTPRSCRLNDAMSRRRNRHCRPFLMPGRMLLRAYSFTVSGLRSRMRATSLLLSSASSRSMAGILFGDDDRVDRRRAGSNTAYCPSQPRVADALDESREAELILE